MSESVNRRWSTRSYCYVSVVALLTAACGGTSSSGNNGHPGGGGAGAGGPGPGGGGAPIITQGVDPGRVEIHRLNNTEYDNTVRHLLQTQSAPAASLPRRTRPCESNPPRKPAGENAAPYPSRSPSGGAAGLRSTTNEAGSKASYFLCCRRQDSFEHVTYSFESRS